MKTTIEINDDLLADAKAFAVAHRTSLRRVLEDALVLLVRQKGGVAKGGIKLRKHPFRGKGLTPQAQNMSQREIRELAYAGRGGKEAGDDRAVDTNILVYAHRGESPFHEAADRAVTELAESGDVWGIPWPCIHEFLAIVTHPRIYAPPTPMADALEQVECWLEVPTLVLLGEAKSHWSYLRQSLRTEGVRGPMVHDARIASICAAHAVRELWTADRDFSRFRAVKVINPLVARADSH